MPDHIHQTAYGNYVKFKVWLNSTPDCPRCDGTGEAQGFYRDVVWWKGHCVPVCDCCKGSGKC